MSGKRWIWIGCGGCLGLIVIFILATVGGFYLVARNFTQMAKNMEEYQQKSQALDKQYPFTKPEDGKIDPERYKQYLQARKKTILYAGEQLDWFKKFIEDPQKKGGLSTLKLIKNFITLIPTFAKIGLSQINSLEAIKMSHKEYSYMTGITVGETLHWLDLDPTDEKYSAAQKYWKPMDEMDKSIREQRKKNPSSRMDVGPIDRKRFMDAVEPFKDAEGVHSDMVWLNKDEIFTDSFAIFVDALTLADEYKYNE